MGEDRSWKWINGEKRRREGEKGEMEMKGGEEMRERGRSNNKVE